MPYAAATTHAGGFCASRGINLSRAGPRSPPPSAAAERGGSGASPWATATASAGSRGASAAEAAPCPAGREGFSQARLSAVTDPPERTHPRRGGAQRQLPAPPGRRWPEQHPRSRCRGSSADGARRGRMVRQQPSGSACHRHNLLLGAIRGRVFFFFSSSVSFW